MLKNFTYTAPFLLESGELLPGFTLSYTTHGQLNAEGSNAVWVCHALTGSANPLEWWPGLIGAGCVIDPAQHFIICANVLGGCYGSTGPLSVNPQTHTPWFHRFPVLTNKDMVAAFRLLKQHLGLGPLQLLIGGSLGGQHALEWTVEEPGVCRHLALLATNARHSAWGIAFNESQRMAIETDTTWQLNNERAGLQGLQLARSLAMLSYRTPEIYNARQQETSDVLPEQYRAASYQRYQGQKLANRFNAFTYYRLSQAMDSHNIGRGRGGLAEGLSRVQAKTLVVGIESDLLFPLSEQEFLAAHIKDARLEVLDSPYGHDAFLVETGAISPGVEKLLHAKRTLLSA